MLANVKGSGSPRRVARAAPSDLIRRFAQRIGVWVVQGVRKYRGRTEALPSDDDSCQNRDC